ncbi:MAG TPA: DegQ family serine endoprotease [Steroidobacteraceae bacterium]|jgi:serine protease Do|nr:DegQ family serine endoprotease [Steroidobacteraceae bacterium]
MTATTRKAAWAAAGIFSVGAVVGLAAPNLLHTTSSAAPLTASAPASVASAVKGAIPLGTAPNYSAIVAQNSPAVVGIQTTGEIKTSAPQAPFGGDEGDPFFRFFRGMPQQPNAVPMHAQGSGFIISSDGLILSNAHVVNGAREVTVKLSDHREFKAKVLGADKASDIAVLKIDAKNLPVVRFGDSDALKVGDYVLAIGEPFGLEETATAGIVSALSRSLPGDGYVPFIQTDAAVNPGNSGGPLFDATGAVVGINSQIYSNSGGYQGVSFAIPINLARQVADQIVKTGHVAHGRLGVAVQTVDQALAESFKLDAPAGALVSKVEPDSAADKAGLKPGDVIVAYNGQPVKDAGQLSMRVNTTAPGEAATLKVWREGKEKTLTARIASADADESGSVTASATDQPQLGLSLRPLTPDERQEAGVSGGLVVEGVQGRAALAGIQPGDVVLGVDGKPVTSIDQLREAARSHNKSLALLIQRGDNRIFVPLALG